MGISLISVDYFGVEFDVMQKKKLVLFFLIKFDQTGIIYMDFCLFILD